MLTKILITSHVDYFDISCKFLLNSIYQNCPLIKPQDILIVKAGGYDDYKIDKTCPEEIITAPHNEFDFTALIAMVELDYQADYFFLMHDTCYVGGHFFPNYLKFEHGTKTKPVTSCQRSMSMGLYSKEFIVESKQELIDLKNTDYTVQGLQRSKSLAVEKEDFLFQRYPMSGYCQPPKDCGEKDFYNTGINRKTEYYRELDLYKIKSNWFSKNEWTIKI
jgi:hypothetical protein